MKKKTTNSAQSALKDFQASLVFGFCPLNALSASYELFNSSEEIKSIIKECESTDQIENILRSFRYFYICYCLKLEDLNQENKNYFYFQLFSQIGDQQTPTNPVYGFDNNEEIVSMIRDIDNMFSPDSHEKQIFESYVQDFSGNASELIEIMQDWTASKLSQFNDLYFQDKRAIHSLHKLLEQKEEVTSTNKPPRKTKKRKSTKTKNENI